GPRPAPFEPGQEKRESARTARRCARKCDVYNEASTPRPIMLSAYISHPECHRHQMGALHPESPERIDAIHDHLLIKGLLDTMQMHEAPAATEAQLARAHTLRHIRDLAARAPRAGQEAFVTIDPDTWMNAYTWEAALHAAGAAVLATDLVIGGKA